MALVVEIVVVIPQLEIQGHQTLAAAAEGLRDHSILLLEDLALF